MKQSQNNTVQIKMVFDGYTYEFEGSAEIWDILKKLSL